MRLRLDLGYDGSAFHGWARQEGLRTVQGDLEAALSTVLRVPEAPLTVAGRTDAGVHARGQVAHLDLAPERLGAVVGRSTDPATEVLRRRVNGVLEGPVRLHRVAVVEETFDARFSALWRRYAYRIADRPEDQDPLTRGFVLAWPRALDVESMNRAGAALLGEHDFAAFCKRREGATTIRTLQEFTWERGAGGLTARVRADAFCHHMVRTLVGCLITVGEGRRGEDWPAEVLAAGERTGAVTVLPAHGLVLEEVGYPAAERWAEQASAARIVRTLAAEPPR